MFNSKYIVLLFSFYLNWVQCHVLWETPNALQPVHGLFVKPSIDGTTGDLYVAATEDNGVKSQWLTDTPVNFLPTSTQNQPKAIPVSYTSSVTKTSSPNEETITNQKQAVITSPTVRYAYAIPVPGGEGNFFAPYPYTIPATTAGEGTNIPYCSSESTPQNYSPFQYFYPPMMSAIANAMNAFKEGDTEGGSQNITPHSPPYWPHTYGYPYQYIMVDPKAWSQSQNSALSSTTTTETSSENS
ncbi:unnamed protein product [Euphydryas editha]|uniref:VMP25 n=1 Tax=Euphydryas editha TaxID=104508 RepID=A0AAU9TJH1_EUPED|nr:unnamed protein product [Euphydryas editha]